MVLKPYKSARHASIKEEKVIVASGYRELFNKAVKEMKKYREEMVFR